VGGGGEVDGFGFVFFGPNGGLYISSSAGGDDGCPFRRGGLLALGFAGADAGADTGAGRGGVEGIPTAPFFEGPKIAFDASLSHFFISKLRATSSSFSSLSSSSSTTDSLSLLFDFG
jgi:hypothetical protein